MKADTEVIKPWWKQLWPWLLILGPLLAAIGCVVTIYLAMTVHVDEPVRNGVKHGLKVEQVQP
jgi:uncharacterized protein